MYGKIHRRRFTIDLVRYLKFEYSINYGLNLKYSDDILVYFVRTYRSKISTSLSVVSTRVSVLPTSTLLIFWRVILGKI